jgi:hypothetical protein
MPANVITEGLCTYIKSKTTPLIAPQEVIIMQEVWDEVHKGERIPIFDESVPREYFRQIDAFLRGAKEKNETKLLIHTPVWVLKDWPPYMADSERSLSPKLQLGDRSFTGLSCHRID